MHAHTHTHTPVHTKTPCTHIIDLYFTPTKVIHTHPHKNNYTDTHTHTQAHTEKLSSQPASPPRAVELGVAFRNSPLKSWPVFNVFDLGAVKYRKGYLLGKGRASLIVSPCVLLGLGTTSRPTAPASH